MSFKVTNPLTLKQNIVEILLTIIVGVVMYFLLKFAVEKVGVVPVVTVLATFYIRSFVIRITWR